MDLIESNHATYRQQLCRIVRTIPFGIICISDEGMSVSIINTKGVSLLGFKDSAPEDHIDSHYSLMFANAPDLKNKFEVMVLPTNKKSFDLQSIQIGESLLNIKCRTMLHGMLIVLEDITDHAALKHEATYDSLTQLVKRQFFLDKLDLAFDKSVKRNVVGALLFIDVDRFKPVNDTAGHSSGDQLLKRIATILQNRVRSRDTAARLGGDEFAVLLEDCSPKIAQGIAEKMRKDVESMFISYEGKVFNITISIGIAPINDTYKNTKMLINAADTACQYSKNGGRNRVHLIDEEKGEVEARLVEMGWLAEINKALSNDGFFLQAQKIMPLDLTAHDEHYEILIRLKNSNGSVVMPSAFLPGAERYDLMPSIDRWVLLEVFRSIRKNQRFSINLSGQTLSDLELPSFILGLQSRFSVLSEQIVFEITETAAIQNIGKTSALIDVLRSKGFSFSLDDFGTGLSSFSYLKNMNVDYVKIDGAFVRDIAHDNVSYAIVKSINEIAHSMELKTVAEYVENKEILDKLNEIGVDYAQGYYIHKPCLLSGLLSAPLAAGIPLL